MRRWSGVRRMVSQRAVQVATNQQIKDLTALLSNRSSPPLHSPLPRSLVLEGHRMILDALRSQLEPEIIFTSTQGITSPLGIKIHQILCDLKWERKLFSLDHKQLSKVSSVETSQGVIGIFQKPVLTSAEIQMRLSQLSSPLILLCDRIRDPGNLGSIIRSGYGFGVDLLINVETCDPWVWSRLSHLYPTPTRLLMFVCSHRRY